MRCCCGSGSRRWIGNYDKVQRVALVLIYGQIGCSLLGSLSPLYNGVLILHLGVSLFGLVAVESSNQSLARTYAFLLFCSLFLDLSWFFLFSHQIWHFPAGIYGRLAAYAVKLTLVVQIAGVSARLLSSLLWIQMYRLGGSAARDGDTDADLRFSFLNPAVRHPYDVIDDDPANFLPPFGRDDASRFGVQAIQNGDDSGTSQPHSFKF
ncbi:uncharacterized protein LOC130999606 [Salvia miltiorrhiza]|uniref:uncharacterized protein LOC130999606 n=1 Tax=Salvia miltiorrhiza TaxID=226208 RepID=UPI0025AD17D8|nr:uncharacterized protein LOC130999606 [Salvia miltiorrhiza]XP_057781171.1 uncharacterized protein LOC130999606 [Salvia miltiorrhiza]XP_057781172.1 uncharacterized protein LOC130999606 [Salvia miltiorrhiza]XP_057781174.1 uncharacterized protein LOC130999606 [Salvia miltiorrhiza]